MANTQDNEKGFTQEQSGDAIRSLIKTIFMEAQKGGGYTKETEDHFYSIFNPDNKSDQGYWKERCLAAELIYSKLNMGEYHRKEYILWAQLKNKSNG